MSDVIITSPAEYYPNPTKDKPLFNGQMYIGVPDTDAQDIPTNQKQVKALQENGSTVNISQPIAISPGGVPVDGNGDVYIRLLVDGNYSQVVLDSLGGQQYYMPNAFLGQPLTPNSPEIIFRIEFTTDILTDTTSPAVYESDFYDSNKAEESGSKWISTGNTGTPSTTDFNNGVLYNANGNEYAIERIYPLTVNKFGAIPNGAGSSDSSPAIQSVITFVESFTDESVSIKISGIFQCETQLEIGTRSISVRGTNSERDILYFSGAGYLFNIAGGRTEFSEFRIIGNNVVPKSNYAINAGGNLTMRDMAIQTIGRGVEWGGGFYHKYYNCRLVDIDFPLFNFNGNNVLVSGCQIGGCTDAVTATGGTGGFVFQGSSFENVSGDCFTQDAGSFCSFNVSDCYFEGCDEIMVMSRGVHTFKDNNIQLGSATGGIRMPGSDSVNPVSIDASGNKWIGASDGMNDVEYIYRFSGQRDMVNINDFWVPTSTPFGGSFLTEFATGIGGFDSVNGVDAITTFGLVKGFTNLSMLNSWVTDGSVQGIDVFSYKEHAGILYIRGRIDGGSATSDICAAIPSNLASSMGSLTYVYFSTRDFDGRINVTNGEIEIQGGTGTNNIVIDLAIPLFS